jgi:hypothetical protein
MCKIVYACMSGYIGYVYTKLEKLLFCFQMKIEAVACCIYHMGCQGELLMRVVNAAHIHVCTTPSLKALT